MTFPLTENQMKIVRHIDGALLVIAGPGSGKTRVLTERITNLLTLGKKRVLALTFSNKAAEEISERIEQNLDEEKHDDVLVGTVHSFCLDVVMNRGNLIGLPNGLVIFESDVDKLEIMKRVINENPEFRNRIFHTNGKSNILKTYLRQISEYKQNFIMPEVLLDSDNDNEVEFAKIYESYNNMMLSQRALDFDDILFYAYRIFNERPQIAKSYTRLYKYIFIDEAQDLNEAQYKVIRALCKDFENIMMVGDPAQSIYGFNGSNSDFMTNDFIRDFKPTEFRLVENFRSTRRIIDAAKKIHPNVDSNAVYPLEGELSVHMFRDEKDEALWIVKEINKLIVDGSKWIENQISYENIAIIARNRYVLSKVKEILMLNNIPVNQGAVSRSVESESIAIKIFEAGLRVIINPYDNVHFNQILGLIKYKDKINTSNDSSYLDLLLNLDVKNIDNGHINIFNAVNKAWGILLEDEENFSKALKIIVEYLVKQEILDEELDENEQYLIQKDIEMWKEHWQKYCSQSVAGQRSLSHFRNQVSLGKTQTHDNSGISLLTVHMSKGLEYDIVFLIGLNEGTFPDYRAKSHKELKEELNNMFVALTRARRVCYITYPQTKIMPWGDSRYQSPSNFISKIGF
ncbi:ATP-dependent helicase [Litchfieldia salsa]|uniref:DNA 3'-5' helicase n=1 Tax=Litchfieldia salsa TaxID=930152 RepID=A0A1H0PPV0_9BACI|nr:ATP-dependent helicase [Litchfieldia salsa]SDP06588.1 DNA helicase-2 / ATP-dependent DNA helicase PcrA [Litchfieldia salsa]